MRVVRGGQLGSTVSLAKETTGGVILVAVWPKHMASEAISECLLLKFFLGEHAPRPP